MFLNKLTILNFKNIEQEELIFSQKLNCFTGLNGAGKTNLLDAIYYLSFCKSYFNYSDATSIKHDSDFFMLKATFNRLDKNEEVACSFKKGKKKTFKRNSKDYKKLSEHIGLLPLVIISPDDSKLIKNGAEERRKFIDLVISQYDREYLSILINYNRILSQRNKLLKDAGIYKKYDRDTLLIYNEQLSALGERIFTRRNKFTNNLIPIFQDFYKFISQANENVSLAYKSQISEGNMLELLNNNIDKDLTLTYTGIGVHRDDLVFKIDDFSLNKTASQGQQKTFLIALKFAEFSFIQKVSKLKPILLLDDIFDKFDRKRVRKIMELTTGDDFGQIFISDTSKERVANILSETGIEYKLFELEKGSVTEK